LTEGLFVAAETCDARQWLLAATAVVIVAAWFSLPVHAGPQQELGRLSEKYESGNRGPGTVSSGKGDPGGVSYGTYQLSSKVGRADAFVKKYYPEEFKGMKAGTPEFTARWQQLAKDAPKQLREREHQYIKETHYDKLVAHLARDVKLVADRRSRALQDVLWSTAVQHGPATRVVDMALKPLLQKKTIDQLTDAEIIRAVYAERGRANDRSELVHFRSSSAAVQKSVARRFVSEQRDALAALEKELARRPPR
jgi:hypothetical protein